jgi:hypothetical protein
MLLEPAGLLDEELTAVFLTPEIFLTERRTMVRANGFASHKQGRAIAIDGSNGFRGGAAGQSATYKKILHMQIVHTSIRCGLDAAIIGLLRTWASRIKLQTLNQFRHARRGGLPEFGPDDSGIRLRLNINNDMVAEATMPPALQ